MGRFRPLLLLVLFALGAAGLTGPDDAQAASFNLDPGTGHLTLTYDTNEERVTVTADATNYVFTRSTEAPLSFLKADVTGLTVDGNAKSGVEFVLDGSSNTLLFTNRIEIGPGIVVELRGGVGTPSSSSSLDERFVSRSPITLTGNATLTSDRLFVPEGFINQSPNPFSLSYYGRFFSVVGTRVSGSVTDTVLALNYSAANQRRTISATATDYVIAQTGVPSESLPLASVTSLILQGNGGHSDASLVLDGTTFDLLFTNRIEIGSGIVVELRGIVGTSRSSSSLDERFVFYSPITLTADATLQGDAVILYGAVDGAHNLAFNGRLFVGVSAPVGAQTPLASLDVNVNLSLTITTDQIVTTGPQTYRGASLVVENRSLAFVASRVTLDVSRLSCGTGDRACDSGDTITFDVTEVRSGDDDGTVITTTIGDPSTTETDLNVPSPNSFKLAKAGPGTLTLTQRSHHLGATEVTEGTLRVTHADALSTTTSGTSVASGATLEIAGVALAAEPITLNGYGVGASGALVGTGTGSTSGLVTLATTSYIGASSGATLTLSGGIAGSHLIKSGTGSLELGANNTHASTSVGWGTLVARHANALGDSSSAIVVDSGAELEIASGVTLATGAGGLFLGSTGVSSPAILDLPAGGTFNRDITLGGVARIQNAAGTVDLTGTVDGAGYPLTLAGAVTATVLPDLGSLDVTAGSTLSVAHGIESSGTVTVDGVVAFTTDASVTRTYGITAARLGGAGAVRCGLTGPSGNCGTIAIDVSAASGTTVFDGIFGGTSGLQANMSVSKRGAGTLILSGTSRITGTTVVAAGELRTTPTGWIGGGLSVGSVTVEAGARLSGAGAVGGGDWDGGVGMSVAGTLDLDGPAGPETMTTAQFDLFGGAFEVGVDGAGAHSQLQVANLVFLSANPVLRVRAGTSIPDGTTVVIVRTTFASPISGTFAGLAEGATVTPTSGPGSFRITYAGGDGDDIALTWVAPPPAPPAADPGTGTGTGGGSAATVAPTVRATTPRRVGNTLVSSVTVAGPGRIVQTAALPRGRAGVRACRATRTVKRAGTYRLACPLSPKARAAAARGRLRLTVVTTFTPTGGRAVTTRATVTLARGR